MPTFCTQIRIMRGKGGGGEFVLLSGILIFCYLGAHARFPNHKTTTSGRMSKEPRGKKERQISPNIPILTAKFSNILNIWMLNMQVKQIMVPVNLSYHILQVIFLCCEKTVLNHILQDHLYC